MIILILTLSIFSAIFNFLYYHRHRLPIVQGATFSFLGPTIAILNLPEYKCPDASAMVNVTDPLTNISSLGKQKAQDSISSVSKKIGGAFFLIIQKESIYSHLIIYINAALLFCFMLVMADLLNRALLIKEDAKLWQS